MDKWTGKVAIVTGASAGIGAAIAEALVEEGMLVVGLARREEKVEEHAKCLSNKKGKLYPFKADVSEESDLLKAFKWSKENLGPVHVLVNNAGIVSDESIINGEFQTYKKIFDVNVLGLALACREAIKQMRENNVVGHIINISSILGHIIPSFQNASVYPASKHAVTALSKSLRQELIAVGSKIKITCVSPGIVSTDIWNAGGFTKNEEFVKKFDTLPQLHTRDIANTIVFILSTPSHVEIQDIIIRPQGEVV